MLLRFDPFQAFDRLSREVFCTPTGFGTGWMPMDAWRRGDAVEVAFNLVRERPQGTFTRQIVLSDAVDLDKVEARYDNGVLFVTAPVAETAKPHKIEIKAGNGHGKAITAGSSSTTA